MAIPAQHALLAQYRMNYAQQRCIVDLTFIAVTATGTITGASLTDRLAQYLATTATPLTAAMRGLATTSVNFEDVRVIGMFEGETTQVAQYPMNVTGSRAPTGDSLASFIAMGFYTGSPAYKRRGASFRMPGGAEGDTLGQQWVAALTGGTPVTNLLTQLNATIALTPLVPGAWTADLLTGVVRRIPYTTSRGRQAYRLPTEPGDAVDSITVPDWAVNTLITSQNGRKVRRT